MSSRDASRELALALLAVGALVLAAHAAGIVVCPVRRFFCIPCPSCGATRAAVHMLCGELATAARMNPLAVVLYVVMPVWLLFLRGRSWPRSAYIVLAVASVIAVAANWAYILVLRP